jgi:hypothetical protein
MAASYWQPDWFLTGWFPAVWFAPADETGVPEEELRPEYNGGISGRQRSETRSARRQIREADARKDYYLQKPVEKTHQDAIAIPAQQGYDSIGAQVAPKVSASQEAKAAAPELKDVASSIQITKQILNGITSAAALKSRQRQDDEAATLAMFALMMDGD